MPAFQTRRLFLGTAIAIMASATMPAAPFAQVAAERRISEPVIHENLAIYFVRGPSAPGAVPLTLAEAMESRRIIVHETGNVNSLDVENTGSEPVFIQSGDIVKGGKQDRVLTVSMIVPPKSGKLAIASFCVEQGRWSPRGKEQAALFETSNASMPSRTAKLAMKAPTPAPVGEADLPQRRTMAGDTSSRQSEVWKEVSRKQEQLARAVGAPVAAAQSRSSLQLTLENDTLNAARAAYESALRGAGEGDGEIIGYVFAINGKINSGDVYESNGLFRKMWPKMLEASITEALGERPDPEKAMPPAIETVTGFLEGAEKGGARRQDIAGAAALETRSGSGAMLFDTRRKSGGGLIHRNYLRVN